MKNLLIVVGILFLLTVSSNLFAQGFTFHGTTAFTQTDFGNDKVGDEDAGFAKMGFGGGIEFLSSELGKKFYWIGSLNFLHHGVEDSGTQWSVLPAWHHGPLCGRSVWSLPGRCVSRSCRRPWTCTLRLPAG